MSEQVWDELLTEHLDAALRSAAIGRWGWNLRTNECAWSLPSAAKSNTRSPFIRGHLADFVRLAVPADRLDLAAALQDWPSRGGAIHHTFRCLRDDALVGRIHLDGMLVSGPDLTEMVVGIARDDTGQMLLDEQLASSFALRDSIARALETSLLPPPLPDLPGFTVDADYRASEGVSTGDFYDLFALAGDDWGLTIGDVGGHGTDAAAITTAIRYTLRAAAQVRKNPTRVIAAANEAHLAAAGDERFTTAHYVRIHRRGQDVQLRVATAGHPELLIIRAAGRVEELSGSGPMLGLDPSAKFSEERASLEPGDIVVAYTDGVVEARRNGVQFGRENLEAFLGSWKGGPPGCAAALHDAVADFHEGPTQDDMATVVLQRNE